MTNYHINDFKINTGNSCLSIDTSSKVIKLEDTVSLQYVI